ncbi:2-succinylbenzoate-CoA ligase, partial [Staphylococcus cohnii]
MEFWLKKQAELNGEKVFIDDGTKQISFNKTYQYASRLAYQLKQLDKPRIGLYIDNSIASVILINAAWLAGIEIAMLNTRLTKKEMLAQMASIEVDTVIAREAIQLKGIHIVNFENLWTHLDDNQYETSFSIERIASIMFTSGTTGPQKAVPQT